MEKLRPLLSVMPLVVVLAALTAARAETPINHFSISAVKADSAVVSWDSPTAVSCRIEYGTDASYGYTAAEEPMNFFHRTELSGLKEGTTYHYRVKSTQYGGAETVSPDRTFQTRTKAELEAVIKAARADKATPKTYYVKPDASDKADGLSAATAWQHPSYAAAKADAGDTIYLLDGTWNNEYIAFERSGIDVAPITLAAHKDARPLLVCTSPKANRDIGIRIRDKSYINVEGITLKRYWRHIEVRKSGNIRISRCSVYTENVKTPGGSPGGIAMHDGAHDSSMDQCLIDGDAWNSIGIGGRAHGSSGPGWSGAESYHIAVTNCTSRNNTLHCLMDMGGTSHNLYIANNKFYNGHSGTVYVHQGHPHHVYIANNEIYDSSDGIHCDGGVSDSVIEGNKLYGIDPKNGHSLHIRTNKKYGDTVFASDNNIIRNNHCRGDVYYQMVIVSGKDNLLLGNDVLSEFRDAEYRIGGVSGTIRNAVGTSYRVMSDAAETTVEYADGRVFKQDGEDNVRRTPSGSRYSFSKGSRTITVDPTTARPPGGSVGAIKTVKPSESIQAAIDSLPLEGGVVQLAEGAWNLD